MKKFLFFTTLILTLVSMTWVLSAQSDTEAAAQVNSADRQAQVKALLEMPKAERRAHLKQLTQKERTGLWFEMIKARAESNGWTSPAKGSGMEPKPVDINQPVWQNARKKAAVGTIAYDSDFPTIGFGGGALVGNRFNTHTGIPVCNPGTVSTIQAVLVPGPANTTSSAGFVLHGPQTTMGGAMALFSTFGVATGVVDSVTFGGLGVTFTGSSFFVLFGDFASVYIPVFGTGSTMGQGHHGVVGYTGGMGPNITGTFDFGGALNSYVRATGVIVPVELMTFTVE